MAENKKKSSKAVLSFFSFVLKRRYEINVTGEELLHEDGPKLLLQSHQSHIDPQLLGVFVAQRCDLVPVISEKFLKIPVIGSVLKSYDAVSVSDLKHGNRDPNVLKNMFSQIMESLKNGKSVLIAPSGNIAVAPVEKIKNKQSAHVLVSNIPDNVKIIGVRVNGLWGSMWSVAWKGKKPKFLPTFFKGGFYIFANLIFLLPKRKVTFEFVDITDTAKLESKSDRKTFNNYLERFYNIKGAEKVSYLKHFYYFPKTNRKYPKNLPKD